MTRNDFYFDLILKADVIAINSDLQGQHNLFTEIVEWNATHEEVEHIFMCEIENGFMIEDECFYFN